MSFLEIDGISYYYQDGDRRRYILSDINATFEKGTFYSILGKSGTGKTTLLSIISGLDRPSIGNVRMNQKNIREIGYNEYRRNNVGIVFQSYNLVPHLSALKNVLLAMRITDNSVPEDMQATSYNLLDYLGIDRNKANRLPSHLSGGEQQRVAIAREH